ncbi:hypothetical protein A3A63_00200 [Candidatus Gottesmanbacteria bacterium RIFCSPLOWO2_01_FULL_46_9]|uniref:tRNA dimethylallyltransferase n=1 Tax=Candidatus Gottesmanbacteria bacterium RIFCSPLOWO2_01_FULL_46_9 TaxID=1798394 RepID=A0A1F6AXL7_9BACT|nr:MAG: hypothetical protein A3A63_00200 [Candidatus Gottesmanbacteria bacterium RIFCSPLOWO2_01_FULL_46_9]
MKKLLVICGQTGTGKTALAVSMARRLHGELISADSRQVYRGMDIGTGKDLTKNLKSQISNLKSTFKGKMYTLPAYSIKGIPVWMYDAVAPDEEFSVAHYQSLANRVISDVWSRGKLPIVVGGTGFYISSLIAAPETIDIPPNNALRSQLGTQSTGDLQATLQTLAPEVFASLNNSDKHNPRRLIRKIEIATHGQKERMKATQLPQYDKYLVGLTAAAPILNFRIDGRVDARVKQGVLSEVMRLLNSGYSWYLPSMNSLGYIQWKSYIEETDSAIKKASRETVVKKWKNDERAYAKRQMTWFKKITGIAWYDITWREFPKDVTESVLAWYTEAGHEHKN